MMRGRPVGLGEKREFFSCSLFLAEKLPSCTIRLSWLPDYVIICGGHFLAY